MRRRLLSILLVLAMLLSVAPVSVFATEGDGAIPQFVPTITDPESEEDYKILAKEIADYTAEYYDDIYEAAYAKAYAEGYLDAAKTGIDYAIAELTALDLSGVEMTDAFRAEVEADLPEIIDTLKAAQAMIEEADVLDEASLDALLVLLEEAGEAGWELLCTLEQAGVDVNQLVILPYIKNELVPAVKAAVAEITRQAIACLKEKLAEAYDALVEAVIEALPGVDAWLYDWLYNNPDKVIAFFAEYGDDALKILDEYKEAIVAVIGYLVVNYGEDVAAYVMENPEEALDKFLEWYDTYGYRVWPMIDVYLEELGVYEAAEEAYDAVIEQLEAAAEALCQKLEAALELLEALKAEYQELADKIQAQIDALKQIIEDLNAAIEKIIEAIELMKENLEAGIAALKEALMQLAEVIDAVEEFVAAMEELAKIAGDAKEAVEAVAAGLDEAVAALEAAIFKAQYATLSACTYGEEMVYVSLGGATAATGTYADAVAEYVEADKAVKLGEAMNYEDQLAYVTENAAAIAEADFITYQMDANEIVGALLDAVIAVTGGNYTSPDWSEYVDVETVSKTVAEVTEEVIAVKAEIAEYLDADTKAWIAGVEEEILNELEATLTENGLDAQTREELKPYVECLVYKFVEYAIETGKAIEAVKTVNENAPVVLVGMVNTLDGVIVKIGDQEIDLGELFAYVVDGIDVYNLVYAIVSGNVTVVDVSEADVPSATVDVNAYLALIEEVETLTNNLHGMTDVNAINNVLAQLNALVAKVDEAFNGIMAIANNTANEAGHAYIAEQIAKALIIVDHQAAEAVVENEVAATCTTDGSYDVVVFCAVCGTELSRETTTTASLGHSWDDGVVTKEPTATETGVKTYTCTVCGETKTEEIPATGEPEHVHTGDVFCEECGGFLCQCGENCPSCKYLDLDCTEWYHEATDYVIYYGMMHGTSTTEKVWSPDMTITRGMVVTTLYRMAGEPEYTAENVYADLDDDWYTDAMLWATENEILWGYGDGNCGPKDEVTREQMALFFQRYAKYVGVETEETADISSYPDAADVSDWATEGMEWAVATGMYEGRAAGEGEQAYLTPQGTGLRTELATLLLRLNREVLK